VSGVKDMDGKRDKNRDGKGVGNTDGKRGKNIDGKDVKNCARRFGAGSFFPLFFLLLFASQAIGLSPARLSFPEVLPGGYASASILLSNPKTVPVRVTLLPDDWLSLNATNLTLPPRGSARLTLELQPPRDAEPRTYARAVRFTSVPLLAASGGVAASFALSQSLPVSFVVESSARTSCVIGGLSIPDLEAGSPLRGSYRVKNDGNMRVTPRGELVISRSAEAVGRQAMRGGELLPTKSGVFSFSGPPLPEGSYDAVLTTQCGSASMRFRVVPRGTLRTAGELARLEVKNETVAASFANTGETTVEARFRGVVLRDGKVVRVVESDPLLVGPGASQPFVEALDLPPGTYELRGSVLYEGRETPAYTTRMVQAVKSRGENLLLLPFLLFALIIILLIRYEQRR